ncbi:type IV-A pilus assembly ATPase PilB [Psychrobium sp. 1_MG-2023]|uniref:type IV-A pilus assembly ATPase PilB n=1 Tax=Psychrobium sp. 1_MG-2023 TaxID=3062624 RepID=UPI002732DACF|nr:type IV-A pilus assembly ATPase PilB [Psychrobium sp. 1_MG-2023]MDP2562036.1 type IV-A pilus assembly ATPase PilB [Psychrobium sp. 1_MG-2023]
MARNTSFHGLLNLFVEHQLLTAEVAKKAAEQCDRDKKPFLSYLVEEKLIDATAVANLCSIEFSIPLLDINNFDVAQLPSDLLNEKRILKHQALPLYTRGNRLYVAIGDPTNINALEEFQFNAGMRTEPILVAEDQLSKVINTLFESDSSALSLDDFDEDELSAIDVDDQSPATNQDSDLDTDDQPIVIYINKLLMDAIRKGASDLHFEPYEKNYRVRFRIDGILHEMGSPPAYLASRLAARLKVMSKMDIAEKRVPQDGRIKLKISSKKSIDFRVSSLPTLFGEKIVLRILDSSIAMMGIEVLGYEPEQRALYEENLKRPQGMILVTGPTGSGKTVSLYTGLNILNTPERNISTAEDPVEINLSGVNQVHINSKAGLDFASALRAFLRQDPDVVMVGEIRDLETAEIAIKAAQTGHLVLSTLHTNSAAETITRLVNMGVPGYNIASSVSLIIAQRLARRLCEHCKQSEQLPEAELVKLGFKAEEIAAQPHFYHAVGCDKCSGGYKGRVGIYEVMPMSEQIGKTIMEGGNSLQIAEIATDEGVNSLRRSALLKALQGVTSLAEVNRVTSF